MDLYAELRGRNKAHEKNDPTGIGDGPSEACGSAAFTRDSES
jgi:hypothetical protein